MTETLTFPYLLFLADVDDASNAKTAFGLRDWAPDRCLAEWAMPDAKVSVGLPFLSPTQAHAAGARALVIGVAAAGGRIPTPWIPSLVQALEAGLDLISGMHDSLGGIQAIVSTAARLGRRLIEVRRPPHGIPIASGRKRRGRRLLTVGTDCALGKKYTALALTRALLSRGVDAQFRATGQTGIMIAGSGIPIDAVVADFVAGAAESLTPGAADDHWDVIEGQGSLFHPAYAGVSLGLLHGSQPDVIVVCHEAGRTQMSDFERFAIPSLEETIAVNLLLAKRTNPAVRCAGVSLNSASLTDAEASDLLAREGARLGLPCADPVRGGAPFERLVDACLEH